MKQEPAPMRDHECSCGHKWTAPVELSRFTQNLSGEARPRCPACHGADGAFVMSHPAKGGVVTDIEAVIDGVLGRTPVKRNPAA